LTLGGVLVHLKRRIGDIKSKDGMTLIEVLVATIIFASVVLMLFGLFTNSVKLERRAVVESLTTYTAQMMLEEVYGMQKGVLDVPESGLLGLNGINGEESIVLSDEPPAEVIVLNYVWTAAEVPGSELIRVSVTVKNAYFEVETTLESLIKPVPSGT